MAKLKLNICSKNDKWNKKKKKAKYYFFLFRWFLIGRYHCEDAHKYRKYYDFVHKILWLILVFGVLLAGEKILKWIDIL